jgi:hypothetical protein
MPRKIQAVPDALDGHGHEPPATLVEAAELGRRDLLVKLRDTVAEAIDSGVPPHALGRLADDVERLDGLVREFDRKSERGRKELTVVADEEFDATAI